MTIKPTYINLSTHAKLMRVHLLRSLGVTAAVGLLCTAACVPGGKTTETQASSDSDGTGASSDTDVSTTDAATTDGTGETDDAGSETGSATDGTTDATTDGTTDATTDVTTTSPTTDGTTDATTDGTTDGTTDVTEGTTAGTTDPTTDSGSDTDGVMCDEPPPEYEVAEACFAIPEGLNSCDECDQQCTEQHLNGAITGDPDFCWAEDLKILCGPDEGVPQMEGMCCYVGAHKGIWCEGRPYLVDGEARVAPLRPRRDWSAPRAPVVDQLDSATRQALAAAWRADGQMEHASIAAFSRFILQMMALGATSDLIEGAQQAIEDEIQHARDCFGLADAYDGTRALGPGELQIEELADDELSAPAIVAATVLEGCVGETIAALIARAAHDRATDTEVREVLGKIAEDEMRHATLAWQFVQWALDAGEPGVREAVAQAFDAALSRPPHARTWPEGVDATSMGDHGRLSVAEQREVIEAGLAQVIGPCASALLDPTRPRGQGLAAMPFSPGAVH